MPRSTQAKQPKPTLDKLPPFPELTEEHRSQGATAIGMERYAEWCARLGKATGAFKIFPCVEGEKRPAIKGWQEKATWNLGEIHAMWAKRSEANIGLAIQPGFVVIDADLYKAGAEDALAAFENEHGALPDTLEFRTARGGIHLIYKTDEDLGNGTGELPNFGDVRGYGGLIVGPGSEFEGKRYVPEYVEPPVALPKHIEAMLTTNGGRLGSKRRDRNAPDEPAHLVLVDHPVNVEHYKNWCAGIPRKTLATPHGEVADIGADGVNGNNTLAATGAMAHDYGLTVEVALEVAREHHNPRCDPPWDDDEYETHFVSGYLSATGVLGGRAPVLDVAQMFPGAKPDYDKAVEEMRAIYAEEDALREKEEALSPDYKEFSAEFEAVLIASGERKARAKRWRDVPRFRERRGASWAVNKWLLKNSVVVLYGDSEAFKTYVTIHMLLCVTTGTPFGAYDEFGGYFVDGPRDAILFVGEGYEDVLDRIDAAINGGGFDRKLVEDRLIVVEDVYSINQADGLAGMACLIQELGARPAVIAVDTYNLALDGNEDDATDAKRAVAGLRHLATMFDAAGLILHHVGHTEKGRPRGSSALRANSDVMILCTPSHESAGNVAALTQYKNRSADKTKYRVHLISKQVDLGKREGEDIVNLSFSASSPRDDEETPAKAKAHEDTLAAAYEICCALAGKGTTISCGELAKQAIAAVPGTKSTKPALTQRLGRVTEKEKLGACIAKQNKDTGRITYFRKPGRVQRG